MQKYTIAHLSDIHISDPTETLKRMWTSKRILGGTNMLLRRRHEMLNTSLDAVVQHILEQKVDHVVVTGDFTTTALETEFQMAYEKLQPFIQQNMLTTIPGNHDIYTHSSQKEKRYEQYFGVCHGDSFQEYPFTKEVHPDLLLIGVNTCLATGFFQAWGEISPSQMERLETILLSHPEKTKVLLIHHYLKDDQGTAGHSSRNLRNAEQLTQLIEKYPVEIVLHGHEHKRYEYTLEHPSKSPVWVLNSGPATRRKHKNKEDGGYNVMEFSPLGVELFHWQFCYEKKSFAKRHIQTIVFGEKQ